MSWSGTDSGGSGISYYNIQVSQNGGSWHTWLSHTTATSATYHGANNQTYSFRAQAVDKCGNIQDWTGVQAWTKVDTEPPQASVDALLEYTLTTSFPVNWSGTDNPGGSGIRYYDVQVRLDEGEWTYWLQGVTTTSATFTNAQNLVNYQFRARATDVAGNVQAYSANAQAETLVVLQPYSEMLPISPPVTEQDEVTLEWQGATAPGTTITSYDVRYRFNGGPWTFWQSFNGATTGADFVFPNIEDGRYEFEVRATNNAVPPQTEPWTGKPEASVIVDRFDPRIEPRQYFPLVGVDFNL